VLSLYQEMQKRHHLSIVKGEMGNLGWEEMGSKGMGAVVSEGPVCCSVWSFEATCKPGGGVVPHRLLVVGFN
jgi:hypothetical protein